MFKKKFDLWVVFLKPSKDRYGVAVACIKNKIVGFVSWFKSKLFVLDEVRIHIEESVVYEDCLGKAVCQKLMLFVENYARSLGPAIIYLNSD